MRRRIYPLATANTVRWLSSSSYTGSSSAILREKGYSIQDKNVVEKVDWDEVRSKFKTYQRTPPIYRAVTSQSKAARNVSAALNTMIMPITRAKGRVTGQFGKKNYRVVGHKRTAFVRSDNPTMPSELTLDAQVILRTAARLRGFQSPYWVILQSLERGSLPDVKLKEKTMGVETGLRDSNNECLVFINAEQTENPSLLEKAAASVIGTPGKISPNGVVAGMTPVDGRSPRRCQEHGIICARNYLTEVGNGVWKCLGGEQSCINFQIKTNGKVGSAIAQDDAVHRCYAHDKLVRKERLQEVSPGRWACVGPFFCRASPEEGTGASQRLWKIWKTYEKIEIPEEERTSPEKTHRTIVKSRDAAFQMCKTHQRWRHITELTKVKPAFYTCNEQHPCSLQLYMCTKHGRVSWGECFSKDNSDGTWQCTPYYRCRFRREKMVGHRGTIAQAVAEHNDEKKSLRVKKTLKQFPSVFRVPPLESKIATRRRYLTKRGTILRRYQKERKKLEVPTPAPAD